MSLYTTLLQFGYFSAWLYAILFWVRGYQKDRLSDGLMGWILCLLALELQDYTFGFAGINVLWEELNGFPRSISLLFGPAVYFFLQAQINRQFHLKRSDAWHVFPWFFFFFPQLVIFFLGAQTVQTFQSSGVYDWLFWLHRLVEWTSYVVYFLACFRLYSRYRRWTLTEYVNPERVRLSWFRNLLVFVVGGTLFKEVLSTASLFLDLSYQDDWWWNVVLVFFVVYVSISAYAGTHYIRPNFTAEPSEARPSLDADAEIKRQLLKSMDVSKYYLRPDLSLTELANELNMGRSNLSNAINQHLGQSFSEWVNGLRVAHFKEAVADPANAHLTLLGVAFDSGFSSKATFNRVFKQLEGCSPREYVRSNTKKAA